jgi:glycosyltransferase involved in cell wall biosynthesis
MGDKIKVLFISDHPLSTSGVGTQSRYLIQGLLATGRYQFRCFGGAVRHDNYDTVKVNGSDDFVIKPTNGFGDTNLMRLTLALERPDVVVLFTDPRMFGHIFAMEDEIHQICPIAYNHLWDNPPFPEFNRVMYDSVDLFNCINWPTYDMVHQRWPDKTNYVPHAVPADLFKPLGVTERRVLKAKILGDNRVDHFVVLYVGRNARRKMPSDIIVAFKQFLNELEQQTGHRKATLCLHTDPLDPEGPNLHHVIDAFHMNDHVVFSKERVGFPEMNYLYNACDVLVNFSLNEGFGLPVLESKMAGRPVIAIKTGGLTRQVEDHDTGLQFGVGLDPEVRMLVGNQQVPYIWEDTCPHSTLTKAFMTMFKMSADERDKLGLLARDHALKNYDLNKLIKDWDTSLVKLTTDWKNGKRPKRWDKIEL